jgi:hypothetical protein
MGQTYGKAPSVTSTPPIFPSAPLVSTDLKESGLWLWQGDAPPPPALARPKSRDQRFLRRIMPAAGWAGWIALPTGLTLMLIAISMMRHPDSPVSADTPPSRPHRPRHAPVEPLLMRLDRLTRPVRGSEPSAAKLHWGRAITE